MGLEPTTCGLRNRLRFPELRENPACVRSACARSEIGYTRRAVEVNPMTPAEPLWIITEHALHRYLDRFAPDATDEDGRNDLEALLRDAVQVGVRDTGAPHERGELLGAPSRPEAVFLCRTDPDGKRVCVTVLDSTPHQRAFRGQKGGGRFRHARTRGSRAA